MIVGRKSEASSASFVPQERRRKALRFSALRRYQRQIERRVMSMSDYIMDEMHADLVVLHRAASEIDGWQGKQSQTFINVGEFALALDDIAYAYLDPNKTMPADLFRIFERLAAEMELERDEEFEGVARLRARHRGGAR